MGIDLKIGGALNRGANFLGIQFLKPGGVLVVYKSTCKRVFKKQHTDINRYLPPPAGMNLLQMRTSQYLERETSYGW